MDWEPKLMEPCLEVGADIVGTDKLRKERPRVSAAQNVAEEMSSTQRMQSQC